VLLSNTSNSSQLPFSVIGALNGVHMFGQNLEVQLSSARTEDTTIVWKSFHDRSLGQSLRHGQSLLKMSSVSLQPFTWLWDLWQASYPVRSLIFSVRGGVG
jgi:hypothetical protein